MTVAALRGRSTVLLAVGAGMALTGCSSPSHASSGVKSPSVFAMTHPLIIQNPNGHPDSWYRPDPIRVRVGQEVTWINRDSDPHDVTADNGSFDSGPIPASGKFRWIARKPGTYQYSCTLHPDMHGVVIVHA